jgi:hypothetical protein
MNGKNELILIIIVSMIFMITFGNFIERLTK